MSRLIEELTAARRESPFWRQLLLAVTLAAAAAGCGSSPADATQSDAASAKCNKHYPCPIITIGAPSAGSTVSATIAVAGTASGTYALSGVDVAIDSGLFQPASGTASWSYAVDTAALANGGHTATARVTDSNGGTGTSSVSFYVSNSVSNAVPAVSISAPAAGATVSGTITVSGAASDDSAVASVSLKIDSGAYQAASGTTSWALGLNTTSLTNGSHIITARATDNAGAYSETSETLNVSNTVTNTPPTVSISAPAAGATVSGTISVSGTSSDSSAVASVMVKVDSGAYQTASGTTSWALGLNTTSLANGWHTITARATDNAGAYTETSETIYVSNSTSTSGSLAVSISAPSNAATVSGMVAVTGTSSGAARLQVRFDALGYIDVPPASSWSYAFDSTAFASGAHTLVARATDSSGATTSAQISLTVSNVDAPPAISIVTPAAGATVSGLFTLSGFAYDINGINQAQFSIDGGAYQPASGFAGFGRFSYDLDTAKLTNGTHTLSVRAADDLGAVTTASTTFAVSNKEITPPAIAIAHPAPGATVSGSITISGTASDNDGLARVEVRENYRKFRTATGTYSWSYALDTRGLSNGSHTFVARAVDLTGNVATALLTVTVANGTSSESLVTPEGVHISVSTASGFSAAEIYRILKENSTELSLIGPYLTVVVNDTEAYDAANASCSSTSCTFRIGLNASAGGSFANNPASLLAHEYGHIWSWYHVKLTDHGDWSPYLKARHLDVDPLLDGSYDMSKDEIAADDFRLLYASPDARQSYAHRFVKFPGMDPALPSWFTANW